MSGTAITLPMPFVQPELVSALGRLNVHARAWGCGKRAIYAYKTLIAGVLAARRELHAVHLVEWTGECRDCAGTGRYRYDTGERADHCWKCSNNGTARLKFVVTVLPDGQEWHHPFDHASSSGREIADIAGVLRWNGQTARYTYTHAGVEYPEPVWWPAGTWSPQQPAEGLSASSAAELLNIVEEWVLSAFFPDPCRWPADRARREMREYVLDLGRVGNHCWYCNDPHVTCGLGRSGPPFSWSVPVCKAHQNIAIVNWPPSTAFPDSALTPALREWRDRHERIGFVRDTMFGGW